MAGFVAEMVGGGMLAIGLGFSIAIANGGWGFFAPSGKNLNEWVTSTFMPRSQAFVGLA